MTQVISNRSDIPSSLAKVIRNGAKTARILLENGDKPKVTAELLQTLQSELTQPVKLDAPQGKVDPPETEENEDSDAEPQGLIPGLDISVTSITKIVRRGEKKTRVMLADGTLMLVDTSLLETLDLDHLETGLTESDQKIINAIRKYNETSTQDNHKNMVSVFHGEWHKRIRNNIKKLAFKLSEQTVDELTGDVYIRILDKKVLEGYDPDKGAFSTYIFYVIRTIVRNNYQSQRRDPLTVGMELTDYMTKTTDMKEDEFLSAIPDKKTNLAFDMELADFFKKFEEYLQEFGNAWGKNIYLIEATGEMVGKSHIGVYRLLRAGHRVKDIGKALQVTDGSASSYCKEVRKKLECFVLENGLGFCDFAEKSSS